MVCRHFPGRKQGRRTVRNLLLLLVCALVLQGCGSRSAPGPEPQPRLEPIVESGRLLDLLPGQAFHFVDHFEGDGSFAALRRGGDGRARLRLGDAGQPVLCVPAPYTIRQRVRLPRDAKLRTAFGLTRKSWDKVGGGVRFIVRVHSEDGTTDLLSEEVKRWSAEETPNWSPVMLDLSSVSGEEVEIELATEIIGEPRPGLPDTFSHAYSVWVNPALIAPSPQAGPNIVLVIVDALRPDHLGCYGYHRETSPFLDRLAASGVLFEDASSQATWTLPSVLGLLTSSYRFVRGSRAGSSTGAAAEDGDAACYLPPAAMEGSLQGELRRAGYTSLACVGGGFLNPALGWDSGFDWYWSPDHEPMLPDQVGVLKRRLSEAPDTPFFLLFHTYEVHNYFLASAHCVEHFDQGYLGPLTDPRRLAEADLYGSPDDLSPDDMQYIIDLYDGETRHTDRYLRFFFQWLLGQPWGENTVVVVTADHGESLGAHGAMSHGGVPYQDVVRVPLILRLPDGRWAGSRIDKPVALVDLAPTLLELAGAEVPKAFVGRSLIPLLDGKEEATDRHFLSESRGDAMLVRQGRWSYISWRGQEEEELYDLSADPEQRTNLAAVDEMTLHRMRHMLAELAMGAARGYRLVVAGRRSEAVVIELECDGRFAYLDVPTLQQSDGVDLAAPGEAGQQGSPPRHRARITLSAGDDPHVILFQPGDAEYSTAISASADGRPVGAERYHLGTNGTAADAAPVRIGPASARVLRADEPPVPTKPKDWGIWIWLPTAAAAGPRGATSASEAVPSSVREQLRSLGYLK